MSVGRGVWYRKSRVTDYLSLDMMNFAKGKDFEKSGEYTVFWGKSFFDSAASIGIDVCPPYRLRLHYTNTDRNGNEEKLEYYVHLDTTPCHLGGKRWWFLCPSCGRRCRILYGGKVFACRICYNLTYKSQQEGRTKFSFLFEAITEGPRLQYEMMHSRSPKKREKAFRRLMQLSEGVELASEMLTRREKRSNKKKRRRKS